MLKLKFAQTVLFDEDVNALKKKTGVNNVNEALQIAVYHYLTCKHTDKY